MGDICNMNDLERLMRSPEGKAHLEGIRQMLKGRSITEVSFSNEVHFIATTLHLDDGETFFITQPSLEVEAIREQFWEVIEREYYVDFPERAPKENPS
jgi:5,10-methylenetetrahydrofolate reductase